MKKYIAILTQIINEMLQKKHNLEIDINQNGMSSYSEKFHKYLQIQNTIEELKELINFLIHYSKKK